MLVVCIPIVLELIFTDMGHFPPRILLQELVEDVVAQIIQRHQVGDFDCVRRLEIVLLIGVVLKVGVLVVANGVDGVLDELRLIFRLPREDRPKELTLLVTDNFHVFDPGISGVAQTIITLFFEPFRYHFNNFKELPQGILVCVRGCHLLKTVLPLPRHVLQTVLRHLIKLEVHLEDELETDFDEEQNSTLLCRELRK